MSVLDNLYHYKYTVTAVVDGNTLIGVRDNGNKQYDHNVEVKLSGIQAPEIGVRSASAVKDKGRAARDFLSDLVLDKEVIIQTELKEDKLYADVYLTTGTDILVNTMMLINEHAIEV